MAITLQKAILNPFSLEKRSDQQQRKKKSLKCFSTSLIDYKSAMVQVMI